LDHLLQLNNPKFLADFFQFAEQILVIKPDDLKDPNKTKSHTAVVTYHALHGNYGPQNTFLEWGINFPGGVKGADVKAEHCWMYFFNPTVVEQVKRDFNKV